jgi:hypothetical protein
MSAPLTKQAATMQANLLRLYDHLPPGEARILHRYVANPGAGSDALLILADALRDASNPRLEPIADAIAALAPTRAIPAPPESPRQC